MVLSIFKQGTFVRYPVFGGIGPDGHLDVSQLEQFGSVIYTIQLYLNIYGLFCVQRYTRRHLRNLL